MHSRWRHLVRDADSPCTRNAYNSTPSYLLIYRPTVICKLGSYVKSRCVAQADPLIWPGQNRLPRLHVVTTTTAARVSFLKNHIYKLQTAAP